jgi:hypothetical protein
MRDTTGPRTTRATGAHRAGPDQTGPDGASPPAVNASGASPLAATASLRVAMTRRIPARRERLALVVLSIAVALVLGAVAVIVIGSNNAGSDTAGNRSHALASLHTADDRLQSAIQALRAETSACGQDLACITGLDAHVAQAFTSFLGSAKAAGVPTHFAAALSALASDTTAAAADFRRLAAARSTATYMGVEAGLGLPATLARWEAALGRLEAQLAAGR